MAPLNMKIRFGLFNIGGQFTFPKSPLVKNAEKLNGKRDMRKKLIKSSRPTYTIPRKDVGGLLTYVPSRETVTLEPIELPDKYDFSQYIPEEQDFEETPEFEDTSPIQVPVETLKPKKDISLNLKRFEEIYDQVERKNPEAAKYRLLLTSIAKRESNFMQTAKNPNSPAYGFFLFMSDNIKNYAKVSVDEFKNNPELQIESAIRLAKEFEKSFNSDDLNLALQQGFSMSALIGGAWLGGPGGVKKVLRGQGNPSDRHWSSKGAGSDVLSYMNLFNQI